MFQRRCRGLWFPGILQCCGAICGEERQGALHLEGPFLVVVNPTQQQKDPIFAYGAVPVLQGGGKAPELVRTNPECEGRRQCTEPLQVLDQEGVLARAQELCGGRARAQAVVQDPAP